MNKTKYTKYVIQSENSAKLYMRIEPETRRYWHANISCATHFNERENAEFWAKNLNIKNETFSVHQIEVTIEVMD